MLQYYLQMKPIRIISVVYYVHVYFYTIVILYLFILVQTCLRLLTSNFHENIR